MRKYKHDTELQIRQTVHSWLEKQGWTCYAEVEFEGRRFDLVARMGHKLWIIECKQLRSAGVVTQALFASRFSDMTSVATWKWSRPVKSFDTALRVNNLGHITVNRHTKLCDHAIMPNGNNTNPYDISALLNLLDERQRLSGVGTQGGHHTKWRAMCMEIETFVRANPGATLEEVLESIHEGSRWGEFGNFTLASRGLVKAAKGGYLHGVKIIIREQRHLTKRIAEYIPTFYVEGGVV